MTKNDYYKGAKAIIDEMNTDFESEGKFELVGFDNCLNLYFVRKNGQRKNLATSLTNKAAWVTVCAIANYKNAF